MNVTNILRQQISSVISNHKAYDVPAICKKYGLSDGTDEEAFNSKNKYVMTRLQALTPAAVLQVARDVQEEERDFVLGEHLAKIDEQPIQKITELTRRRILSDIAFVRLTDEEEMELEFLKRLWPIDMLTAPSSGFGAPSSLAEYINQHRLRNDDLNTKELMELFDIYNCSQRLFSRFLEALVHPMTREQPEPILGRVNSRLSGDGFVLLESGKLSGSPIYKVVDAKHGGKTPADSEISKTLAAFNSEEIHERWQEALTRRAQDPRAAITSARTLLEDVCKWLLNEAAVTFPDDDDLPSLYKKLAAVLNLAPDNHTEKVFKQILGNCQSIVESLGSIRNKLGDAHSQGPLRAKPQPRHAELAVNLAGTMAMFLISTWEARKAENQKAEKA